jgi:hypothetical protein
VIVLCRKSLLVTGSAVERSAASSGLVGVKGFEPATPKSRRVHSGNHVYASKRLAEAVLAILTEAGFGENDGLLAYGALFTYMVGQLDLDVAAERDQDSYDARRFAELTDRTAAGGPTPGEFFDFGFDLLLTGLREALRRVRRA